MSDEPLSHLARRSPPWRQPDMTECGRPLVDVARVITFDEAKALIAKHGKQRAVFLICMTCANTVSRYCTWEKSPTDVIGREGTSKWSQSGFSRMDRELFAIAALIEAHREEFDGFLADLGETVSLADARAARKPKAAAPTGRRL
jgi:hypothetical protein